MWKLKADDRVVHWRDFRKTIGALPLEKSLEEAAKFWHTCPFVPYYLDPDRPENWPDPWTLIYDNTFCDLAKALGIIYTMSLTDHKNLDPEIRIYDDKKTGLRYNLACFCKGKYILNLIDSEVVNIEKLDDNLNLTKLYPATQLNIEIN